MLLVLLLAVSVPHSVPAEQDVSQEASVIIPAGLDAQECLRLVREVVEGLPASARASNKALRHALAPALAEKGFTVTSEVSTREGTVDIFATLDGVEVSINIERAEPGGRAARNLWPLAGLKVIVLRRRSRRPHGRRWRPPGGLHAIIEAPE